MINHLYLPALQKDKSPKIPDAAGRWDSYTRRLLLDVSGGIVVDEQARVRGVSSVPDIWGRPLMFASALRPHSLHPLRQRLLQEWRGLLSLIALSQIQSYGLEFVYVSLDGGKFSGALKRLEPAPVLLENDRQYAWTDIVMLRYEGIPVGALSPATLVYSATEYAPRLARTNLNLKDPSGYLQPPQHPEEKLYIAEWVSELQKRLTPILNASENNRDRESVQLLNVLLGEWLSDLREDLQIAENRPLDSPEVEVDEDPISVEQGAKLLSTHRVYRELLRPLKNVADPSKLTKTDLQLTWKRNLTDYRHVIVITSGLISGSTRIWDKKRLSHLGGDVDVALKQHFNAAQGQTIDAEDLKKYDGIWIRPERYFLSDVLLKAAGGGMFLAEDEASLNVDRRFVLPFKKEILSFFSSDEIRDLSPEFVRETDQAVTFRFTLPVGLGRERIEKTFKYKNPSAAEGTIREVQVPVIEVFPRYLDPTWRRYYVFHSAASHMSVNPVVTAVDASGIASRVHNDSATGEKVRISTTSADAVWQAGRPVRLPFPEALEFTSADGETTHGLVLLPRPEELRGRSGSWRIGVDFGTSNTNVWVHEGGDADARPWRLRFDKYLRCITTTAAGSAARTEGVFLPSGSVSLPVPTILRIHMETQRDVPILDYFPHLSDGSERSDQYDLPPTAYSNIKWDDEDRKTQNFLEGLLLLVLIEAAAERVSAATLVCSYPKAFSHDKVSVFQGDWEAVIKKLMDGPNRVCDSNRMLGSESIQRNSKPSEARSVQSFKLQGPSFEVEGVAAGEFFGSEKAIKDPRRLADKANGAICLDVGGGTTDISVWFNERIVFDASILLAGRQISDLLMARPRILELLFSPAAAAALYEKKDQPVPFAARLNLVLRAEEAQIRDMLIKHANVPELRAFRRLLVFEFGAITFYACTVLAAADQIAAHGDLLRKVADSGINLHWGGNAAKFINWIDFGRYSEDGLAAKMLNAIAFQVFKEAGAKVPASMLAQRQSPQHKCEAAGGLTVMELGRYPNATSATDFDTMPDSDNQTTLVSGDGLVSGENIELTTGQVKYLSIVSEKDLFKDNKTLFQRTTLERLTRFVDVLNFFGVQFGLFSSEAKLDLERYRTTIANNTRGVFIKAESKKEGNRMVEPVFLTEVKLLLKMLAIDLVA